MPERRLKAGVEAATLLGMPFSVGSLASAYHTSGDTIDTVSAEAVKTTLLLADQLARELDGEISPQK